MRKKADGRQAKADRARRKSAMPALAEAAVREPPPRAQLVRLRMWYARVMGGDADGQGGAG